MKMDVKVIIVLVCVFVPCWVSATREEISRDGPRHLPRRWPNRNAASSSHFADPQRLVIGGRNSELGEFPFIVSLQMSPWGWNGHKCGGVIISQQTVLTAAHCVEDETKDTLKVVAGKLHLNEKEESQQIRNVTHFVTHPGYTRTDPVSANDVALVFVKEPFEFNKFVRSIPLAVPMAKESEGTADVAGWGDKEYGPSNMYPKTMQTATLVMSSHEQCVALMKAENSFEVTETMLCTLNRDKEAGSGDSGGPLVKGDALIGIVSWKTSSVSVFTRVSSFTQWIMEVGCQERLSKTIEKDDNHDIPLLKISFTLLNFSFSFEI